MRLASRLAGAVASVACWPETRVWLATLPLIALTLGALAGAGVATGLLIWAPGAVAPGDAAILLAVPALSEEVVFRGLLTPDRERCPEPVAAILPGLILFIAWHPLQALWLTPASALLTDPGFLALVALLGVGTGALRWSTGSIWPGVVLHWATVLGSQALFGGPSLRAILD